MNNVHSLYKLIILAMLEKVDFELSNSQISSFMLDEEYTDYFTIQGTLADMTDSGLIEARNAHNSTRYHITAAGEETLEYFGGEISQAILEDMEAYFKKNKLQMRNDNAITADYYRNGNNEFTAQLLVKEKEEVLVEVSLTVPLEQQAILLCDNWKKKSQKIYGYLMEELL